MLFLIINGFKNKRFEIMLQKEIYILKQNKFFIKFYINNSVQIANINCKNKKISTWFFIATFVFILALLYISIPHGHGVMARIPGFHEGGQGSIPGVGEHLFVIT